MKSLGVIFLGLFALLARAEPPAVIITHASAEWDLHEETKWPALKTLEAVKRRYPENLPIVSLQTKGAKAAYFLSSLIAPESVVFSQEGELNVEVDSPYVLFLGGNFSDCNKTTVQQLLLKWGKSPKYAERDLDILFVTPGIYDYVRGVNSQLAYPEPIRKAAEIASQKRRARTGIGSPTFRLDWIMDQFESDEARASFLCERVNRAYELASSLPEHGVNLKIGRVTQRCSEKKHVLNINFFYPNAPAQLSLPHSLLEVLPAP